MHALIADDDDGVLRITTVILEREGIRVTQKSDGQSAMDFLFDNMYSDDKVDLFICDLLMPGLTGFEITSEMEAYGIRVPVIVLSGYGTDQTKEMLAKKGFHRVLCKPISREELLSEVFEVLTERV